MLTEKDVQFFAAYPDFPVERTAKSLEDEFVRLAAFKQWTTNSPDYMEAVMALISHNGGQVGPKPKPKKSINSTMLSSKENNGVIANLERDLSDLKIGGNVTETTTSTSQSDAGVLVKTPTGTTTDSDAGVPLNTPTGTTTDSDAGVPLTTPTPLHIGRESFAYMTKWAANIRPSSDGFSTPDTVDNYFDQFPGFAYDRSAPLSVDFDRLALEKGWDEKGPEYRKQRAKAFENEFRRLFGTSTGRIQAWQSICIDMRIQPLPPTIEECKKKISACCINIFDFIDCERTGEPVWPTFDSPKSLGLYSFLTHKVYPLEEAKENPLLECLLEELKEHLDDLRDKMKIKQNRRIR